MSDFPRLKTGAVLQYPAQRKMQFSTSVLRFADGSEQRFRGFPAPLHRWLIRLDLLDEAELHRIREFFRVQGGRAISFEFTDPWDGTIHADCTLEDDEAVETLLGESNGGIALTIRENRS